MDEPVMSGRKKALLNGLIVVFFAAAYLALAWLFAQLVFPRIPLVIDWKVIWTGIQGADLSYDTGIRNPPWSLLPILPLGLLSEGAGWGWLAIATIAILVISVPRISNRRLYWISVILLVASFPSLRLIADGNLEVLIIGGVLLLLYGYRLGNPWVLATGALLAMAKAQETWLLLPVLALHVVRTWPTRRWLTSSVIMAIVMVPTLIWRGEEWIATIVQYEYRGTLMDSSLVGGSGRLGLPDPLFGALWLSVFALTLWIGLRSRRIDHRPLVGMLIAASLLLAPYSAGNSYLTVLAIGVIPLLQRAIAPGLFLVTLSYIPYLVVGVGDSLNEWRAYYWTVASILTWAVLGWRTYVDDVQRKREISPMEKVSPEAKPT